MSLRIQTGVIFSFLALLLSTCNKDQGFQPEFGRYTLFRVHLTDNPTDLEEVNIDLKAVVIIGRGERQVVELGDEAGIYNLLDYQNGLSTIIGEAVLENFDYVKEVRLLLGDRNSVKAGGSTFPLKVPSGSSSGLKIKTCIDLSGTMEYDLLLDFDAQKSVKRKSNGQYQLHPVIKVKNEDAWCDDDDGDDDDDDDDD